MIRIHERVRRAAALVSMLGLPATPLWSQASPDRVSAVRGELEARYAENNAAFMRGDVAGVMRLRHPDFHTVTPDGTRHDRAGMEERTRGFINGVTKWNVAVIEIDSLRLSGDTAFAITKQHLDRMALREDGQPHHVQTWVTQREVWIRSGDTWLMWRVDGLRNQRRLIDGRP
jgi:ketosteroid isomerase-like protein